MIDEKKKMTAQAHLLAQMMGSQSLKIQNHYTRLGRKKNSPERDLEGTLPGRCAA